MTTTAPRPTVEAPDSGDPRLDADVTNVDIEHLHQVLLGHYPELRLAARKLLADERFHRIEGQSLADHRERVLGQLRLLATEGDVHRSFPERFGGAEDHGGFLARFEELTHADPSLQIKSGVQWGLFASAIYHLGTERNHDEFLADALSVKVPGAFAMTETGHGSDVAAIGTTATYDPETQEFVIHTPFRAAWKDYLGNAGQHGTAAAVFARLITAGVDHGVHAFYVPIRDEDALEFLPGVGGEDDGLKGGLNGIDNGRLWFDHVRIPRTNLLNRYGDVAEDGTYSSPIASPGRRFFTMLGTLVQGRVSLDGAAVTASRIGLTIAITYGNQRRQFNAASPTEEVVILDYAEHQRRLLPLLAETYAAGFAHEDLLAAFDDVFSGRNDTTETREDLETLAAALKPASTLARADHPAGRPRGVRRRRVPGREPAHRAARRHGRLRDVRGRQHGAAAARRQAPARRLRHALQAPGRDEGRPHGGRARVRRRPVPHAAAPRRADDRRRGRPPPLGRPAARDGHPARAAGGPGRDHGRGDRAGPAPGPEGRPGHRRGAVQRAPARAGRGGPRARRAGPVGVVHRGARAGHRPGHAADPHLGPRPVRAHAASSGTSPGTCSTAGCPPVGPAR